MNPADAIIRAAQKELSGTLGRAIELQVSSREPLTVDQAGELVEELREHAREECRRGRAPVGEHRLVG